MKSTDFLVGNNEEGLLGFVIGTETSNYWKLGKWVTLAFYASGLQFMAAFCLRDIWQRKVSSSWEIGKWQLAQNVGTFRKILVGTLLVRIMIGNAIWQISVNHGNVAHRGTLHCTALHCTALHCTAQHCTALHHHVPLVCDRSEWPINGPDYLGTLDTLHCTLYTVYCTHLQCTL